MVFVILAFLHPIALLVLHNIIKRPLEEEPIETLSAGTAVSGAATGEVG